MKLSRRVAALLGYDLISNRKDHLLPRHLRNVLTALDVNCVLDVGANDGRYGAMLRQHGFAGRIVSFEPNPEVASRLRAATARDPDWYVREAALGREPGRSELQLMRNPLLSSLRRPAQDPPTIYRDKYREALTVQSTVSVDVQRLDDVFDELVAGIEAPRVFVKLDTQGHDLEVLAGSSGCLSRVEGLQSEVSVLPLYDGMPDYLESLAEMRRLGFEVTGLFPIQRDTSMIVIEFDCVMRRYEGS